MLGRPEGMARGAQGVPFHPVQWTLAGRNDLGGDLIEQTLLAVGSEKGKGPIGAEIRLPLLSTVIPGVQCARAMTV